MLNGIIILSGVGAIQSVLFALLVKLNKLTRPADWILLIWFLTFFSHFFSLIVLQVYPIKLVLVFAKTVGLLHGPLFLLYTKSVFQRASGKQELYHFLTFLGFLLVGFWASTISVWVWEIALVMAKMLSLSLYPIAGIIWMNKRMQNLKASTAKNFGTEANWIKWIALLLLINAGVGGIHLLADLLLPISFYAIIDILSYVSMLTIIGFFGLKYGVVYEPDYAMIDTSSVEQYKSSPLSIERRNDLRHKIEAFFSENEAYLETDFSLARLSDLLNTPKHHLSQIINAEMKSTFYDLVNANRIQFAIRELKRKNDALITLEALGYDSGFKSKSAFFHHFKKITGKTPGQFRKELMS